MTHTMQQIARELGVSRTTVSLVLKGQADKYRICEHTARRIREHVDRLGYRPNYLAAALSGRRTRVIGVVFPNVFESFMSETVKGVEDVLYPADYTMMLCTSRFDRRQEQRTIEQLAYRGVDGFIVAFNAPFRGQRYDYSHLRRLCRGQTPVVFVDRSLPSIQAGLVAQNDEGAARRAAETLVANGARRIAYVSLDIDVSTIRARRAGFRATLREHNLPLSRRRDILLKERNPASDDLRDRLRELCRSKNPPDGYFVTTNGIANKTMALLREEGVTVGRDVQLAKFGADPAHFFTGAVCVEQPHHEMGRAAAEMILNHIENPGGPRCQSRVVVKPSLRVPDALSALRGDA